LDEFRLAVLGSSTAAGEGASDGELGWVSLLDAALSERTGNGFMLNNLAVGGYTSEELKPGSGANGGIDDALDWGPHLVVIALAGSNDLSNGTSTDTLFERLNAMRDAATEAGAVTFFLTTAPKDLSDGERQALKDWAGGIEQEFGTCPVPGRNTEHSPCVIDVFTALANADDGVASEYSAGDGIHLNDTGHERLFDVALPIIEPYVCANLRCD
jgi:lysophospholipase L1-like esterase